MVDNPDYYKPQDLAIGSIVECFKHKFMITDADRYVLKYMTDRKAEFPAEMIDTLAKKHDMWTTCTVYDAKAYLWLIRNKEIIVT